jgi:hypothetical protein
MSAPHGTNGNHHRTRLRPQWSRVNRSPSAEVDLLPPWCGWHGWQSAACPDVSSTGWGTQVAAPHPFGGSLAIGTAMAASVTGVLGDLATALGPRPVRVKRPANRATFSREVQVRVRRSPQIPVTRLAMPAGAGVEVSSPLWRRDHALDAQGRCKTPFLTPCRAVMSRRIPRLARAACRASTPRPDAFRHWGLSKAVVRCTMASTARATGCARIGTAGPGRCWFSRLVRHVWPAGGSRQHQTAAAETAHGSGA